MADVWYRCNRLSSTFVCPSVTKISLPNEAVCTSQLYEFKVRKINRAYKSYSLRMACQIAPGSLLLLILFVKLCTSTSVTFINSTDTRSKRELGKNGGPFRILIFPEGSNVQLIYCMTIGTYARPQGVFTMGVTAGLAWPLPHVNSGRERKPAEVFHRRSRRELYPKIEMMLKTQGKDGRACVLKALCRAGKRNVTEVGKGSFIQEMMHSIFTLPQGSFHEDPKTRYERAHFDSDEDCDQLYPTCLENL